MRYVWKNRWAKFGGNWSHDTSFRAKKLKGQSESQFAIAGELNAGKKFF